jgi:hypothetical protein
MRRRPLQSTSGPFARIALLALALACVPESGLSAPSDSPNPAPAQIFSAEAIKAAYLTNFIRFTHWPEDVFTEKDSAFVIGVVGNRDLEDQLLRLADRQSIRERPLRVLRIRSIRDLDDCHLVFFEAVTNAPGSPDLTMKECVDALRGRPVLTVSDSPDFIPAGGMINLYREGENLRFEIAPHHASSAKLTLSSRLLALARIIPAP